jgi:eukaryotic-like serine/threonine-protein kinase
MTTPAQTQELELLIERLSAQLAAGETLVVDTIPEHLIDLPVIQNLLRMARVNQALESNRAAATSPTAMPAQIGQWRILRLLGQGGMGAVWLGDRLDGAVEHQVAIKCVHSPHPRFVERLKRERQILATLNHPNVAGFLDAGVDAAGLPWLAMEYVDGQSVTDWSEQQQLGLEARLKLFLNVCAGVAHAHRHLIVHRDIKPGNILVNAQGEPKLLDFGISKLLESDAHETTIQSLTPSYAAPAAITRSTYCFRARRTFDTASTRRWTSPTRVHWAAIAWPT